jgi:hypothetical protein
MKFDFAPSHANIAKGIAAGLIVVALLFAGCGSGERRFPGRVSGTVTFEGEGLDDASISFEGGPEGTFGGPVEGGKYELDNVAEGTYHVVIYPVNESSTPLDPKASGVQVSRNDIPARYRSAATSGFQITIGSGANTLDLDLGGQQVSSR